MKIAFVVKGYLPYDRAGVPIYIQNLRDQLLSEGIDSIVIAEDQTSLFKLRKVGSIYYLPNFMRNIIFPIPLIGFLFSLIMHFYILFKENISIIHAHTSYYGGYQSIILAKITRKPIIVTAHGIDRQGYFWPLYHLVDKIIYQTDFVRNNLLKRGLPEHKLLEIPNCIRVKNTNYFSSSKSFVFLARFDQMKNPLVVVEAAKKLFFIDREIKFHMIGDGPLLNQIKVEQIDNIILYGQIADIESLVSKIRPIGYLAVSSKENYSSTSLLELINFNIPVIATNVGETKKMVNERNGYLIDNSVDDLVNLVQRIINEPKVAEEKANRMKIQLKRNYSYQRLIRDHLSLYQEILLGKDI